MYHNRPHVEDIRAMKKRGEPPRVPRIIPAANTGERLAVLAVEAG